MTTLEIRIDGALKRIAKLEAKITRLEKWIATKSAKLEKGDYVDGSEWMLEGEIEYHQEDIERAKKELIIEHTKVVEYDRKHRAKLEEDANIPNVPSVEAFLANWKAVAHAYYINGVEQFQAEEKAISRDSAKEHRKQLIALEKRTDAMVVQYAVMPEALFAERLEKDLTADVDSKRRDLFRRCSAVVGVITDATRLGTGNDGAINGYVIGENGMAEVSTIYAGGYNIQRLHYRVLVKSIVVKVD